MTSTAEMALRASAASPHPLGGQPDHLGPGVPRVRLAADEALRLEVVQDLHHRLLGDSRPGRPVRSNGSRGGRRAAWRRRVRGTIRAIRGRPEPTRPRRRRPGTPPGVAARAPARSCSHTVGPRPDRQASLLILALSQGSDLGFYVSEGSDRLDGMEVRDIRPGEEADAGRVTRLAYAEFADPGDTDWDDYLAKIEDVAGRAGDGPRPGGGRGRAGPRLGHPGDRGRRASATTPSSQAPPTCACWASTRRRAGAAPAGHWWRNACAAPAPPACTRSRSTRCWAMKVAQRLYESMGFVRDPARDWRVTDDFTLYAFRLDL